MKSVNTDVAYEFIRKRILNGDYPPGHPLLTEALADEIKVSRTPIRDALRKLEADGLVIIRAHIGASVKKMGIEEFGELSELRLALESHAAGLAARHRTEKDLAEIEFAVEAMRSLTERIISSNKEQPLLSDLIKEDIRFHIAIMTAARNEIIKREILRLHLLHRLVSSNAPPLAPTPKADSDQRRREVLAKHVEIFDAIKANDAATAKREMEFHLQELIDHSIRSMTRAEGSGVARELTAEELLYTGQL